MARLGLVKSIPKERYFDDRQLRLMDRAMTLASVTAGLALEDAALFDGEEVIGKDEVATVLASAHGEMPSLHRFGSPMFRSRGTPNPAHFPMIARNIACGQIAMRFGLRGWSTMLASGEASGAHAISRATEIVALGRADIVVVGAYEVLAKVSLHQIKARWQKLGLIDSLANCSSNHHVPVEGACFVVLESADHAARRGCHPYAMISHTSQGYRVNDEAAGWDDIVARHFRRATDNRPAALHVRGPAIYGPAATAEVALARELDKLKGHDAEIDARAVFGDAGAVTALYQTVLAAQWLRDRQSANAQWPAPAAIISAVSQSGAYTLLSMHGCPGGHTVQ